MSSKEVDALSSDGTGDNYDPTMGDVVKNEGGVHQQKTSCGILDRYPVLSVILFACTGASIGVGLSYWEPSDASGEEMKVNLVKWLGLFGDLFIRALKAVILPLVFINVTIAIIEMSNVGKAGSIGWKSIVAYTITTVMAATIGILGVLSFKGLFREQTFVEPAPAEIRLSCDSGSYVSEATDGTLVCGAGMGTNSSFIIEDLTGSFVMASGGISADVSLSDTVYNGIFTKTVVDNFVGAFVDGNFVAVIFLAAMVGIGISQMIRIKGCGMDGSIVMQFLKELDQVFMLLITWIIKCTPFAVLSLISSAIGNQTNMSDAFANVGYLCLAIMSSMIVHYLFVYALGLWLVTRTNPFGYLKQVVPAQTMAFACASSAATLPVTMRCVRDTSMVPESILKFVLPLGATINMDGSSIYFPCCCIWLAILNGVDVNAAHYLLLVIIASLGSAGAAPVPSSGLVLIITAYNTVFNTSGTPEGFAFIVAIDWYLDRLCTVMNVTGDTVVCRIISHLCPIHVDDPTEKTNYSVKSKEETVA